MTAGRVLRLERLSQQALVGLDLGRAAAFWAVSPIEVHGPHLPLGTDLWLAEHVLERAAERWAAADAARTAVLLPPLPLGADVLPIAGSLQVPGDVVLRAVIGCGRGLARIGFRALVLGNNHGGPRHMLALEQARRALAARTNLVVVNPFSSFVKAILARDPATMTALGVDGASAIGGQADAHSGTFETSMALSAFADAVEPGHGALPASVIARRSRLAAVVRAGARVATRASQRLGGRGRGGADALDQLANLLDWIAHRPMPSYVGAPAEATPELGARATDVMAGLAVRMLERGLAGEDLDAESAPPLWALRALTWVPW